ncbi:MAG TPA: LTA synthase family protein [Bordetella sp.]|nr:LTA synthase family protein [Bordetella sp.]
MVEAFWLALATPFLIGLACSWLMEALLRPRPVPPWRRPVAALAVHIGIWTFAFAIELALFRRPYFAMANVLAVQLIIVLVSLAKYQALREPFIYQDFEYFTDAIRHPRLYLPFMGVWRTCAAALGVAVAFWAGFAFEESMIAAATVPVSGFVMATGLLGLAGGLVAWLGGRCQIAVSFIPASDLERLGLFACLWSYAIHERQPVQHIVKQAPFAARRSAVLSTSVAPHLVVIQSESFFDVRREFPEMQPSILREFDALCAESVQYGELEVAAWGANTIRSEFAFLSGYAAETIGVHRFNPYRRLARRGKVPTLASHLQSRGYRTICIHPYHGSFYRRDKVLPLLGFDEFIDIREFAEAPRFGAYISDQALADKVAQLIGRRTDSPLYIHVITMENHGPLHWEAVGEKDRQDVLRAPFPQGCDEFVAYGRHLRNSDAMFRRVADALRASDRPGGMLGIFGDHVPIMSQAYRCLRAPLGTSDYLVWKEGQHGPAHKTSMKIKDLATMLAEHLET